MELASRSETEYGSEADDNGMACEGAPSCCLFYSAASKADRNGTPSSFEIQGATPCAVSRGAALAHREMVLTVLDIAKGKGSSMSSWHQSAAPLLLRPTHRFVGCFI